jgi:hypothetical protein
VCTTKEEPTKELTSLSQNTRKPLKIQVLNKKVASLNVSELFFYSSFSNWSRKETNSNSQAKINLDHGGRTAKHQQEDGKPRNIGGKTILLLLNSQMQFVYNLSFNSRGTLT